MTSITKEKKRGSPITRFQARSFSFLLECTPFLVPLLLLAHEKLSVSTLQHNKQHTHMYKHCDTYGPTLHTYTSCTPYRGSYRLLLLIATAHCYDLLSLTITANISRWSLSHFLMSFDSCNLPNTVLPLFCWVSSIPTCGPRGYMWEWVRICWDIARYTIWLLNTATTFLVVL